MIGVIKMKTLKQKQSEFINDLVKAYNKKESYPVANDDMEYHIKRYIKASKEGRIICKIESVSSSGMSRVLKFLEMAKNSTSNEFSLMQFWTLFRAMGETPAGKYNDGFRVNGCGMDMVFHTHYCMINAFYRAGFIDAKTCDKLAQKTPHKV
jgi:hypothetical protein